MPHDDNLGDLKAGVAGLTAAVTALTHEVRNGNGDLKAEIIRLRDWQHQQAEAITLGKGAARLVEHLDGRVDALETGLATVRTRQEGVMAFVSRWDGLAALLTALTALGASLWHGAPVPPGTHP